MRVKLNETESPEEQAECVGEIRRIAMLETEDMEKALTELDCVDSVEGEGIVGAVVNSEDEVVTYINAGGEI